MFACCLVVNRSCWRFIQIDRVFQVLHIPAVRRAIIFHPNQQPMKFKARLRGCIQEICQCDVVRHHVGIPPRLQNPIEFGQIVAGLNIVELEILPSFFSRTDPAILAFLPPEMTRYGGSVTMRSTEPSGISFILSRQSPSIKRTELIIPHPNSRSSAGATWRAPAATGLSGHPATSTRKRARRSRLRRSPVRSTGCRPPPVSNTRSIGWSRVVSPGNSITSAGGNDLHRAVTLTRALPSNRARFQSRYSTPSSMLGAHQIRSRESFSGLSGSMMTKRRQDEFGLRA
jgi:hypothetical protein